MINDIKWEVCANGIWKATIGKVDAFSPAGIINAAPRNEKLKEIGKSEFPHMINNLSYDFVKGKTLFQIPLTQEERIYGLGLQFMKVNHRGRTRFLRINSDPVQDTGESHAAVPFYISSEGYGLLFNTSRIVTLYCGSCARKDSNNPPVARDQVTDPKFSYTPLSDLLEAVIPDESVEIMVFSGRDTLEIVQRYNLYFGGGVLPPRWGLGFWHRVPSTHNASQVLEEALEYRKRDFPCDVIGLEPGWHSKSYPSTYEWSQKRFPAPKEFINSMEANGFKVNLWEHGYVSPDAAIYPKLEKLSGSHTVWGGLAPDYSLREAREILKDQHRQEHIQNGVSGYKLDECDGSELTSFSWMFPSHASFPSGHDGEQLRQVYGLLLQKMTYELFKEANKRTYGLVRASNAAASSLPYVVYSDLYDHRQFVRALCNSSFSGLLWTPEVRNAKNAEDWVRRFQTVCFSPLAMINAWCDGTKPWSYSSVEGIIRKYVKLRMQLLPYIYSTFAKYYFEGLPPFRAMQLEPGYDASKVGQMYKQEKGFVKKRPWDTFEDELDDQYMMGDYLLVAPLFEGEKERLVYLPEGKWYDFETGEEFNGGRFIKVQSVLEKLPLYVRDGAIIPMMPPLSHTPKKGEVVPLEVRHYGEKAGSFMLYDDDGETMDFETGNYGWRELKASKNSERAWEGHVNECNKLWNSSSYGDIIWNFIGE